MSFASHLEESQIYLENLKYPVEMKIIEKTLSEFCIDDEWKTVLLEQAIEGNINKLKTDIKRSIRKCAVTVADKLTEQDIWDTGIPGIPDKDSTKHNSILERYLGGFAYNSEKIRSEIESEFFFVLAKRILTKDLLTKNNIVKHQTDYVNIALENLNYHLKNPYTTEEPIFNIEPYLDSNLPQLKNLFPYIKKNAAKRFSQSSVLVYKSFIQTKMVFLSNASVLDSLEQELLRFAYQILIETSPNITNHERLIENFLPITLCLQQVHYAWDDFPIHSKLSIYVYIYLVVSEDLPLLRNTYLGCPDIDYTKYSPISRELLRRISKTFPITNSEPNSIYTHSPFNWFKLIESVSVDQLSQSRPLHNENDSIDVNLTVKQKTVFSIPMIEEILDTPQKFALKKLSNNNSSHITICVSGFLSENDDHKDLWKTLTELYPESTFYSFTWESSSKYAMLKSLISFVSVSKHYNECYINSQYAGMFLAECIMSENVFQKSCISLIGFSLGTMVIFQCLQCLGNVGRMVLHDVIFMGSAVPESFKNEMRIVRESVVAGKLVNVTCKSDAILNHLFPIVGREGAFGVMDDVPGMERVEVSEIISGHQDYRSNFRKLFKQLDNF